MTLTNSFFTFSLSYINFFIPGKARFRHWDRRLCCVTRQTKRSRGVQCSLNWQQWEGNCVEVKIWSKPCLTDRSGFQSCACFGIWEEQGVTQSSQALFSDQSNNLHFFPPHASKRLLQASLKKGVEVLGIIIKKDFFYLLNEKLIKCNFFFKSEFLFSKAFPVYTITVSDS